MAVFPREIVAGKAYLRDVERNLAKLAGKPALILWPDSDPGFCDADLTRWGGLFPSARTVHLQRTGQFLDEDAPDEVVSAIRAWWQDAAAGDAGPAISREPADDDPGAGRRRPSRPS